MAFGVRDYRDVDRLRSALSMATQLQLRNQMAEQQALKVQADKETAASALDQFRTDTSPIPESQVTDMEPEALPSGPKTFEDMDNIMTGKTPAGPQPIGEMREVIRKVPGRERTPDEVLGATSKAFAALSKSGGPHSQMAQKSIMDYLDAKARLDKPVTPHAPKIETTDLKNAETKTWWRIRSVDGKEESYNTGIRYPEETGGGSGGSGSDSDKMKRDKEIADLMAEKDAAYEEIVGRRTVEGKGLNVNLDDIVLGITPVPMIEEEILNKETGEFQPTKRMIPDPFITRWRNIDAKLHAKLREYYPGEHTTAQDAVRQKKGWPMKGSETPKKSGGSFWPKP